MSGNDAHKLVWGRFTEGDETALLELYHQHYLGLINYGRMVIKDRELVNECFMDMLIEFWKKRATLPRVDNVRSYLMTSFRRHILHQVEAEKKRNTRQAESQQFADQFQVSYEDYIVGIQTDNSLQLKIRSALKKLTDRQLELIQLRFFEDLDYEEIALRCGITRRTAYNIIYDALKTLKEELSDGEFGSIPLSLFLITILINALQINTIEKI